MSKKQKANDETSRRLYCICRQPNDEDLMMLMCDFCDEWFHPSCVGLDDSEAKATGSWRCPGCVDVMSQNPMISKQGLLGFQGRVAPKNGWSGNFPIEDIDESVINVSTKRHKLEGYNLFKEEKVLNLSSNHSGVYIYFRSQCMPAMKSDKPYNVFLCLKNNTNQLKWGTCSCPAGIDGQCKHTVAVLYYIIDLCRQGLTSIPPTKTCSSKLQTWHVRKPLTDDPLLFSDISFVKHDPLKKTKRELSCNIRTHNPVPDFARSVSSSQMQRHVQLFDINGTSLPVIDTIRANEFKPVVQKQQILNQLQPELFTQMSIESNFAMPDIVNSLSAEHNQLYQSLVSCDQARSVQIEKRTRMQSKNNFWFSQRAHRLTSSTFGTFCKLKARTNPVKTCEQKKAFFVSSSVQHGLNYECMALAKYCEQNPCLECPMGLIVNPCLPFLGSSPDLLIKENGVLKLVEVKCPYSIFTRKQSISAQLTKSDFYLHKVNDEIQLKKTHDYFYQVQGQLNLTGIDECKFVVFVPPEDIVVVLVKKDKNFFETVMLPKLCNIWFSHLLPYFHQQL